MKRNLEFFESNGPLAWFVGWALVMSVVGGFIITVVAIVHGPGTAQLCIQHGGTWSHTLSQQESRQSQEHYDDKCQMP